MKAPSNYLLHGRTSSLVLSLFVFFPFRAFPAAAGDRKDCFLLLVAHDRRPPGWIQDPHCNLHDIRNLFLPSKSDEVVFMARRSHAHLVECGGHEARHVAGSMSCLGILYVVIQVDVLHTRLLFGTILFGITLVLNTAHPEPSREPNTSNGATRHLPPTRSPNKLVSGTIAPWKRLVES